MAPRTTATRWAALVLAAVLIGGAAPATIASAQSGNGLYEPFPEAAVKKRAQRYVERLGERTRDAGRRYTDAELAAGVFVRPDPAAPALPPAGAGAAGTRAGARGGDADLALGVQILLLLVALAIPATAFMQRARAA